MSTTINLEERLRKLKLDKEKCPMTKLNEIMGLLKTKVDFKLISSNYYSENDTTYLIEAEGFKMTAHGVSTLNLYDAQKNAAIKLFEKLHYRYCIMSPISNVACKTNSEKNDNIENRIKTIHINNNIRNLETFIEPKATIVNTKSNSLIVPPSSDGSSNLSLENNKTTNSCDYRFYPSTSSTTLLNTQLSTVSMNYNASKTTVIPNYVSLLQEKCLNNNWKFPNYLISELKYIYGHPEFTVTCIVLSYTTLAKDLSKEIAKDQAAEKMYNLIKNLSNEDYDTVALTDIKLFNYLFHDVKFRDHTKDFAANSLKNLEMFYYTWNESKDSNCLDKSKIEAVNMLGKIAKVESLTVKYVVILQNNDKVNVMVQLSTVPIAVNIGQGNTVQRAKEDAAITMLIYLKAKFNVATKPLFE